MNKVRKTYQLARVTSPSLKKNTRVKTLKKEATHASQQAQKTQYRCNGFNCCHATSNSKSVINRAQTPLRSCNSKKMRDLLDSGSDGDL